MTKENPASMARWISNLSSQGLAAPSEAALAELKVEFEKQAQAKLAENLKLAKGRIDTLVSELRTHRQSAKKAEKKINEVETAIAILLDPEHADHVVVADNWSMTLNYGVDYVKKSCD